MLRYLEAFSDYNPLEDPLPEDLQFTAGYVEQKALQLLPESFTLNHLNAVLENLFQLKRVFHGATFSRVIKEETTHKYEGIFSSQVYKYFLCAENAEKTSLPDDSEIDWSAFFAVIALASLSDFVSIHHKVYCYDPNHAIDNTTGDFEAAHKEGLLLDATEALGYARLYKDREQRALAIGQSARKTRISNYQPLKQAIFEIYSKLDTQTKQNDTKTAALIYKKLPEKIRLISKTENPEHQIKVWIGQYKKGTLAGIELLQL